jgi:hypothetical protein
MVERGLKVAACPLSQSEKPGRCAALEVIVLGGELYGAACVSHRALVIAGAMSLRRAINRNPSR